MSGVSPALVWPDARAFEALHAAARSANLALRDAPAPVASGALADAEAAARFIAAAGEWLAIDVDEISVRYGDLPRALARLAPALVRLPGGGFVALAPSRANASAVRVIAPDGSIARLAVAELARAIAGADEARVAGFVESILASARVPARRRAKAAQTLRAQRLDLVEYGGIWSLRAAPGSSFTRNARDAGLFGVAAAMLGAHAALYAIGLAAWALLGRGVLRGVFDSGWLAAFALLLVTAIPLRLFALWAEARFALGFGTLLKQRLLQGALNLDPEVTRRQGLGELLARVVESEAVERLALAGGLSALLGIVESLFVVVVLAESAGGGALAALFVLWVALSIAGVAHLFAKRRAWTDERLRNTGALVERMLGHRTRLAQERRATWHSGEDGLLDAYLDASRRMDRASVAAEVVLARGFLAVGLLALVPAVLGGASSIEALATGIFGVLLGERALLRFWTGWASVADAALAWRVTEPVFRAAATSESPGVPGLTALAAQAPAGDARRPLLEARELTFRHEGRGDPVLAGCSLALERGARVLLEGPSGGGKSTLAAVLTGLRAPTSGLLLFRGLDPASVGGAAWRRAIACAPQFHENHVLSGPFAFNLLLGERWPARARDLSEAEEVCRELGLGPLLDRMPGGLFQVVGETGWQLSHGERSRLFLARALLQRADVVILDESFAALDPDNLKKALRCALDRAPSLLVIAHP